MGLFGKDPDPKEQVREWTRKMRGESRVLDREIRGIMRAEEKAKRTLLDAAKKGERDSCRILAKEIVQSRKAVAKLYTSKAHINSVVMSMNQQLATAKMAGSLQQSTEVMKSMSNLVRLPEISATMQALSKEMMKMGIIEEMMEDTMEGLEPEELEEEAEAEVDKILFEITKGELGRAPDVLADSLPPQKVRAKGTAAAQPKLLPPSTAEDYQDEDLEAMQERLQSLRS